MAIFHEVATRFQHIDMKEILFPFIDTEEKLNEITAKIQNKTFVIYTIKNDEIRNKLKEFCRKLKIPCIPILSRIIRELSSYLNTKPSDSTKDEYEVFTEDYFVRIDAMNYVLSHDDGQNMWDLDEADIIIVGVSRTSKSPTSVYLSHKGYKVANIPFVNNINLPENLNKITNRLIIGLTINPERLIEIRRNRLVTNQNYDNQIYADLDEVLNEINEAKKFFMKNNWPVIDVTNRSVEEIAAIIIKEYSSKKQEDINQK
jgi:regulator of PEP synthase PpsR (kinase-PPPase family)